MWFRIMICLLATFIVVGCKLEINVPEGGRVITKSENHQCGAEQKCVVDVVDTYFDETFTALPDEPYTFGGWSRRDKGLCGGSRGQCVLSTTNFSAYESLMAILESDEVFFLEPVFYRSDFSGRYRMTPGRDTQLYCGEVLEYYAPWQPFELTATHLGDHISADFISGEEIPGAELVSRTVGIAPADFPRYAQRAVFSHPSRGMIDYFLFYSPHPSSKNGFSGNYYGYYIERNSGRLCSISNYLAAEKLSNDGSSFNFKDIPEIGGSYRLSIEPAPINCSDSSSDYGPGTTVDIQLQQTGNMFTLNNPAEELIEARTTPRHQERYRLGGRIRADGSFRANGFARIYYNENTVEWTSIRGILDDVNMWGKMTVKIMISDNSGFCTEKHAFTGYRLE